ncbi:MAG: sulfur oxidation c-type cytochrome SoxX [Betaproteobacteria bacterium]|jgi:sulfur-oxidizing protein SoxX|nr:MAG: sulfur oxidation c-type cytochrome SoxX [Betaproteobacteria bacterium]
MRLTSFVIAAVAFLIQGPLLAADGNENISRVDEGRRLAHNFDKGNCLACHSAPTDPQAVTKANIAPPLIGMRVRFGDRHALRDQIWDAAKRNPQTIMPPFGRHMILSDDEIELIIDYLYTL